MVFGLLLVVLHIVFRRTVAFLRTCVFFSRHRKPEGVGKTSCTSVKTGRSAHKAPDVCP